MAGQLFDVSPTESKNELEKLIANSSAYRLILFSWEVIHENEETGLPSYGFCPDGVGTILRIAF
jgi:hypothetical protein